jgi:hypothetical protein
MASLERMPVMGLTGVCASPRPRNRIGRRETFGAPIFSMGRTREA